MFDPNKPYNDLPLLSPEFDFNDVEILKRLNAANTSLGVLNGITLATTNRELLSLLIEPLTVREAVASSEIENINTTVQNVFEAELIANRKISLAEKETIFYRSTLLKGFELVQKQGFLNTNSFIELQSLLEPTKPGIRKLPGTQIKNITTGEVLYTPPEGESLIRNLLANFEAYYNDTNHKVDPLIKMAILHYQFESIHPFYDGNGRTGRILMVLYLLLVKRLHLPILFISGYINKYRNDYYRLLRKVTTNGAWKDWVIFILDAVKEQSDYTSSTVQDILSLRSEIISLLKTKLPKIYSTELVEYLISSPFYSQSNLSSRLGLHRNTSSKYLNEMVNHNIIEVFQYKNEKIYYHPVFLKLLS